MNNQELINKLLKDLKKHSNMQDDLYLQKCEALRTLYSRENDISHALGMNLEMRKKINETLLGETLGIIHICFISRKTEMLKNAFISRESRFYVQL